jgi:cytochrome P450
MSAMSDPYGWQHLRQLQRDPDQFFRELHRDQGDMARFPLGTQTCWSFAQPGACHEVLTLQWRQFRKPTRFRQVLSRILGEGLLLAEGTAWQHQRPILQRVLNRGDATAPGPALPTTWQVRVTSWTGRSRLDLDQELRAAWMEQLLWQLAGAESVGLSQPLRDSLHSIQNLLRRQFFQIVLPPRWWPWWGPVEERQSLRIFHQLTQDLWQQAAPGSLYHRLKQELPHGDARSNAGLSEARTLLFNAYETTACGLVWTLWHLARHPHWQRQIVRETSPNGLSPMSPPSPTLAACWREALRLHPPAYLLSREACEPVEIVGQPLSPGDQVFLFLPQIHRDPRWCEFPDEFRPERFLDSSQKSAGLPIDLAFGQGPRRCAGEAWGTHLSHEILAEVLRHHQLGLASDAPSPNAVWRFSLAPQPPVWVDLAPR